jgi:hypothetical protein
MKLKSNIQTKELDMLLLVFGPKSVMRVSVGRLAGICNNMNLLYLHCGRRLHAAPPQTNQAISQKFAYDVHDS